MSYIAREVKKEILAAIIIGFALGLVITFGIWSANKNLVSKETVSTASPETIPATPEPEKEAEFFLKLDSPKNELLTDEESIVLSGSTLPGATLVILSADGEKIIGTDSEGNFSLEIELTAGVNFLTVVASDFEGHRASEKLSVVYSTAEI